ncbi:transcriptional regulator [Frondihabitans sucicola]|uniref:Transcriptional regulator n=1 Tax=Frondihabitans sucicola TaxID=1268041 RepID=A0ABN6Y3R2_9MICO|nr:TetR/AcrR family transcriptional regulator [Frondihabitans sucicola]BDZ51972.1 transcriptional regulator [Frondihabitans sucicola]
MTNDAPTRRYAKGDAKRREILAAALTVISERGYRNSSLQEIADSVGLTKAGVLHYFDSREGLLVEVLKERDEADVSSLVSADDDAVSALEFAAQHNREVPGLVELFSRLVVESESDEHPGHDYIAERYADLEKNLAADLRARQSTGTVRSDVDPDVFARVLTAVSDGIQLQWLHDRTIDMRATYAAVVDLLSTREPTSTDHDER